MCRKKRQQRQKGVTPKKRGASPKKRESTEQGMDVWARKKSAGRREGARGFSPRRWEEKKTRAEGAQGITKSKKKGRVKTGPCRSQGGKGKGNAVTEGPKQTHPARACEVLIGKQKRRQMPKGYERTFEGPQDVGSTNAGHPS